MSPYSEFHLHRQIQVHVLKAASVRPTSPSGVIYIQILIGNHQSSEYYVYHFDLS